jgi:WASH complex subunit strumpellin
MEEKIGNLDPEDQTGTSRKIQQYQRALQEIEKYDQIENNLQVRQYIEDTRKHLKKMLIVLNLRSRLISEIRQICDVSYCSLLLKEYVSHMQNVIQKDSKKTLMLRSTFMKLSSIMNTPMNRLVMLMMLPEEEKEART